MISGTQTLDAILNEARSKGAELEGTFDVPVLLVVTEENEFDGVTSVTSPAAGAPPSSIRKRPVTFVVPIQPRYKDKHPAAAEVKLSFGRSSVCDLLLPFSSISKHHGFFTQAEAGWSVIDVGSTNGTEVEGQKAGMTGVMLADGCAIQFGTIAARFLSAKAFCAVLRQRLGLD